MEPQSHKRRDVAVYASHVPLVESVEPETLLTTTEASLIEEKLSSNKSTIPQRVQNVTDTVYEEITRELEFDFDTKRYAISPEELHGALARVAIRASSQTVADLGAVLQDSAELQAMFEFSSDTPPES